MNDIIWVINLGENKPDSARQHKLGHAKPLGYGSVKLVVKDGMIREFSNDNATGLKYMTVPFEKKNVDYNAPIPSFNLQDETIKSLLVISDVNSANQIKVDYPHVDGKEAIYEWFSKNRTNPKSLQTLPNILDQNKHLT